MSRIGKKPIIIPEKTTFTIARLAEDVESRRDGDTKASDAVVTVAGPLGTLSRKFRKEVVITTEGNEVHLKPAKETLFTNALWGTYASHISNMVEGVNSAFEKRLVIEGIGFRASIQGDTLTLNVGFSHPVEIKIPEDIKAEVFKNIIVVKGINKEIVGRFAALIRSIKKPEPYKGKGIHYEGEIIRRKQGKKAV